jgi:threonine/homoserine/homoserine lactone efflux protein
MSGSLVLFGEGLMTGIMLTMMLGPVTMVILRHGLQINTAAGILAAGGTWFSDLIYIAVTFWMTTSVDQWANHPDHRWIIYSAGGAGLLLMGIWMSAVKRNHNPISVQQPQKGYIRAFTAGFLVNSLSPFTLFFWLGAALFLHLQDEPPAYYYLGLMTSLCLGDTTKAWLAPKLNQWLKAKYVYWLQVVSGVVIAGTGIYIVYLGWR